jgi:hypothetical protein
MRNRIENNGPQNDEESYQSKLKKIYEERRKLQNSIEQIKNEQILNKKKERNFFEQKAHMNFIKDNFQYMNALIEQHFKNNLINNDEEIKKFVKKDFDKFQNQIIEDFSIFKNKQKVFLERLQNKFVFVNKKKNNLQALDENGELKSEPLYNGENIKNIFIEMPQNKFNLIINSAGDTKQELINNNESKFYKNKICQNVIQCMGGAKDSFKFKNFSPPLNQFIEVNNTKISIVYYRDAKKEFNNKRKNEIEKKKKEEKIINDETKKINFNEKLFETKYKNYIEEIKELNDINEKNMQIIGDIKNKMTKDKLFDDLTQQQLNIFKKSENEIIDILSNKNNQFPYYNINNEEEKEEYIKKLNLAKEKYEEDYQNINKEIENIKKKYRNNSGNKNKNKTQNKNRNKSSYNITKRKYYNDNPIHYNYNYDRASIPIKKILKKFD